MKKRTKYLVTGAVVPTGISPTVVPDVPKGEPAPINPSGSTTTNDIDYDMPEAQVIEPIINGEWEMEQVRRGALLAEQEELLRRGGTDPYSLGLETKKKTKIADEEPEEEPTPQQPVAEEPQQPANTWTLLGVTMKKSWWLFIGGALALLIITIITLAIAKKR